MSDEKPPVTIEQEARAIHLVLCTFPGSKAEAVKRRVMQRVIALAEGRK